MPIGVVAVPYGHFSAAHLILYRVSSRGGNISVQSYSVLNYFPTVAEQNPNVISFFFSHERRERVETITQRKPRENHMFPDIIFQWFWAGGNSVQNCVFWETLYRITPSPEGPCVKLVRSQTLYPAYSEQPRPACGDGYYCVLITGVTRPYVPKQYSFLILCVAVQGFQDSVQSFSEGGFPQILVFPRYCSPATASQEAARKLSSGGNARPDSLYRMSYSVVARHFSSR